MPLLFASMIYDLYVQWNVTPEHQTPHPCYLKSEVITSEHYWPPSKITMRWILVMMWIMAVLHLVHSTRGTIIDN